MDILNRADLRRGILATVLIILPTILLGTIIKPTLQIHQITGANLWQMKNSKIPDIIIEPLNSIRLKSYFFKFRLMKDVESIISEPALYKKYKNKIEMQISTISMPWPALESVFLIVLAFYYLLLWIFIKKYYPEGQL